MLPHLQKSFPREQLLSDALARSCYASDASIYAVTPQAVLLVKSEADVARAIDFANKHRISLTPRGAGSGLAGGALGEGLILDFSGYRGIVSLDSESKTVTVRVGTIYEELNAFLKPHRLVFAPDPSSGDVCQIGGMLATNASGPRTVKYGTTKDYVLRMVVFLHSGKRVELEKMEKGSERYRRFAAEHPEFATVENLVGKKSDLILIRWPKVKKNSSGYNLYDFAAGLREGVVDYTKIFIGSEGTLGFFPEVTLRLVPLPDKRATVLAHFANLLPVGDAVLELLPLGPSALEIIDGHALELVGREKYGVPRDSEMLLLVEFDGGDLKSLVQRAKSILQKYPLSVPSVGEDDPVKQARLWNVRKAVLPTLYRYDPVKRPVGFIEDSCLPSEQVPRFLRFLDGQFKRHNLQAGVYGHIGDGNVHIRPLLNLRDPQDFEKMRALYEDVYAEVLRLGGSLAAEHGDGRLRAPRLKELYGKEIYDLFVKIKKTFDPQNIFNPGVKFAENEFTQNINLAKLDHHCAACGKCNTVCPSYDITRTEILGSRGWVRALAVDHLSNAEARLAIDACLNCKACMVVCPAGVDTSEIVRKRREKDRSPWKRLALGTLTHPSLLRTGATFVGRTQIFWKFFLGSRNYPKFTGRAWSRRSNEGELDRAPVAYFPGCPDTFIANGVADAVLNVMDNLGVRTIVPKTFCCGAPLETFGYPDLIKKNARKNLKLLEKFDAIVTSNGSCYWALKAFRDCFAPGEPEHAMAQKFTERVFDFSEYIEKAAPQTFASGQRRMRVTYHDPCHLRAAGITLEPRALLRRLPGVEFVEMPDAERCCGAAGAYRYLHYHEAMQIVGRKVRGIEAVKPDLVATGNSLCAFHIADGIHRKIPVLHVAQVVEKFLAEKGA